VSEVRIARIIGRLNVGGPAIQAITLTRLLESRGYRTLLVRGSEASHEGSLDDLAADLGVHPRLVAGLRRELHPSDLTALLALMRILRAFRPQIVHTHLAKAGTLGRLAALLAFPRRPPLLVHTFHGHSLEGYFSPRREAAFRRLERMLAKRCARIVAVSSEVADDLVRLGVAPRERIEVIAVGFDLAPFVVEGAERAERAAAVRAQLGVPLGVPLVTLIARLVPIKRVDRFLRIASEVAQRDPDVWVAIVGDGELRAELRSTALARGVAARLVWAGFRRDMPDVCFASDVVALSSDNEGTPVSLIEAQAAAVPVISTRVGGAPTVVLDGTTGRLVGVDDESGYADALLELLADRAARRRMGEAGREHVLGRFSLARLLDDVDGLYRALLRSRAAGT
jgi:glycosyltransferase involved in cell wall biosynthesis